MFGYFLSNQINNASSCVMTMGKYILDIPQRNIKPDTSGVHLYLKDINPS